MFFQAPKHHTLYSLSDFERSTRGHGLFGEAEALPDPDPPTEVMSEMVGAEAEARRVAGVATSLMGEGRGDELMYSGAGCLSGTG
jgi:hypothetical protein